MSKLALMVGIGLALKRALRAECNLRGQLAETAKAQKELKQVSEFQAGMLAQIDTTQAGKAASSEVGFE